MKSRHLGIGIGIGLGLGLAFIAASDRRRKKARALLSFRRRPGVEFFKSITVNASPEEVYDFWVRFEDFSDYFTHVKQVQRTGRDNEWRWTLNAPTGADLEWDIWITESIPGKAIAWESAPGAPVRSSGVVQFTDTGNGQTRVDVRLAYRPTDAESAKAVVAALGASPASMLDRDFNKVADHLNQPFPDPNIIPT